MGINQIADLELTERDIEESRWKARLSPAPNAKAHGTESSIPQAEIESNAPYQPFHTDRRVGLHIYSEEEQPLPPSPSGSAPRWLLRTFGHCLRVEFAGVQVIKTGLGEGWMD